MAPRDWWKIPFDLILKNVSKLGIVSFTRLSFMRLRAVCRTLGSPIMPTNLSPQLPWLILPYEYDVEADQDFLQFFSLSENKFFNCPGTNGRKCFGSSYGWLFLVGKDGKLSLLNPLTQHEIQLPHLNTFPELDVFDPDGRGESFQLKGRDRRRSIFHVFEYFLWKGVLSSDPACGDDWMVGLICGTNGRDLGFCRAGDVAWTQLNTDQIGKTLDIIFFDERLHVFGLSGRFGIFEVGPPPKVTIIEDINLQDLVDGNAYVAFYLVKSGKKLLLVCDIDGVGFDVYLIQPNENPSVIELSERLQQLIFVTPTSSLSLNELDFPDRKGGIYFLHSFHDAEILRIGRFGSAQDLSWLCELGLFQADLRLPAWFEPNLR